MPGEYAAHGTMANVEPVFTTATDGALLVLYPARTAAQLAVSRTTDAGAHWPMGPARVANLSKGETMLASVTGSAEIIAAPTVNGRIALDDPPAGTSTWTQVDFDDVAHGWAVTRAGLTDAAGCIQLVNAQTEALFGYPREALLSQPVELLVLERFQAVHQQHRASYAQAPRTRPMGANLLLSGRRRDGSEFPVEIALSPLMSEEVDQALHAGVGDRNQQPTPFLWGRPPKPQRQLKRTYSCRI